MYENDIFCSALNDPTYAVFHNSYVSGRYDGSLVGSDGNVQEVYGGCSGLLSYHSALHFTENKVYIHL